MNTLTRIWYSIFLVSLLCTCAAPSPEFENQQFVPKKDIIANTLYQQATDMYKAGRFIEAEMKLRQALYIFPEAENFRANLALVLKSNAFYPEANEIYKDLIKKYPEAYDYQFALADSYYRERKFADAAKVYRKAMLGFEALPDLTKASQAARSLAGIYFLSGKESDAFCSSNEAYIYSQSQEQTVRHAKILIALGYYNQALDLISPLITNISDVKDPALLKLAGIVFYANSKPEEARKYFDLALENQSASRAEGDAELLKISDIMNFKFPPPPVPEGSEEEEPKENKTLIFNVQTMLYWPDNLVKDYYDYSAANPQDSENN